MKTKGTHNYYVYILTNKNKTVLYTGITNDLNNRIRFHKEDTNLNKKSFTSKYKCFFLIYFDRFQYVENAIKREKQIKGWTRMKKLQLIEAHNPEWKDLSADWSESK